MPNPLDLSTTPGATLTNRLETLLRRNIEVGVWGVEQFIPTELEIAEGAGVSRNTVRAAIQRLVDDGLLKRVKGHGTFVTPPKLVVSVGAARIRETMHQDMSAPVARIVRDEYLIPPPAIAELFGLGPHEKIYYIERVRYQLVAASSPVMYHYAWLRSEYAASIDQRLLTLGRLQDQLLDRCGLYPHRITESLSAISANASEAKELGISIGSPLFQIEERRHGVDDRLYTMARFAIVPHLLRLDFEHTPPPPQPLKG